MFSSSYNITYVQICLILQPVTPILSQLTLYLPTYPTYTTLSRHAPCSPSEVPARWKADGRTYGGAGGTIPTNSNERLEITIMSLASKFSYARFHQPVFPSVSSPQSVRSHQPHRETRGEGGGGSLMSLVDWIAGACRPWDQRSFFSPFPFLFLLFPYLLAYLA